MLQGLWPHCPCGYLCAGLPAHCRGPHVRLPPTAEEGQEDVPRPVLAQDIDNHREEEVVLGSIYFFPQELPILQSVRVIVKKFEKEIFNQKIVPNVLKRAEKSGKQIS